MSPGAPVRRFPGQSWKRAHTAFGDDHLCGLWGHLGMDLRPWRALYEASGHFEPPKKQIVVTHLRIAGPKADDDIDDGHARQTGAAQHGGSPLQELWVVRSHADITAGWCPPAPLMPQEAQSRVPEHGSGSPSLWLGFPQALWRSRQRLS